MYTKDGTVVTTNFVGVPGVGRFANALNDNDIAKIMNDALSNTYKGAKKAMYINCREAITTNT